MSAKLEVELIGSPIGCPQDQRATVVGLGLRKMHSKRVLKDTPAVRGMIAKISHLVEIVSEKDQKPKTQTKNQK